MDLVYLVYLVNSFWSINLTDQNDGKTDSIFNGEAILNNF